ncbi:MAG TPA: carboxypeptidase regulatory-like domain-containing protein [Vicinamibacterales bacterium]
MSGRTAYGRYGNWRQVVLAGLVLICGLFVAASASAQQASGIAGTVRDSSGLALPGVTVEAASPALIERTRAVTTDGEGRYSIVDLRPGIYSVTFSLEGFSTVKREGIELGAGFTAAVNISLSVGAISETITVTGASPVVDTQSMRRQETITQRDLEALPSGVVGLQTLAYVTPGFAATQADVGGTRDTWSAQGAYAGYHGKVTSGTRAAYDGFRNQYFIGAASGVGYISDQGNIQEMQLETTGMSAEAGSGSTNLNIIPKSGSNTLRNTVDGYFSNGNMQGSNIDDTFRAWSINSSSTVDHIYRIGVQSGGPIKQDRIWYFAALGRWGSTVIQPGAFYNSLQGQASQEVPSMIPGTRGYTATLFYPGQPGTPFANLPASSSGKPAASFDWYRNHSLRTTAQVTSKQRVNFFFDIQKSCRCTTGPFTGANSIESERGWDWWPSGVVQGTWTMPVTSRLLLEAGAGWQVANWVNFAEDGVTTNDRSILELATNYRYGATTLLTAPKARTGRSAERFSVSYVTGTHNIKVGVTDEQAFNDESRLRNHTDTLNYDFLNGKPNRLQYYAQPYFQQERQLMELGLYAQDAWKIQRLTLNLGIRWDYINMGYPAFDLAAGPYVPARHVDELSHVPDWKDTNPRVGVAYDLFGNGRTALKASIGRFNQLSRSDFTRRYHPFSSSIVSAQRNWTDSNNNYIPDCDLANFAAQDLSASGGDICGVISSAAFGKFLPQSTLYDPSIVNGNRDFIWDINTEIDHELFHGVSVSFAYNHNWDGTYTFTDDLSRTPADFDEYCITVPNDPRLPNAGKEQCGFYDVTPSKQSAGQLYVDTANKTDKHGKYHYARYWDGFTISGSGRLPRNISIGGGVDFGQNVDDHCFTIDVPNQPNDINNTNTGGPFCKIVTGWKDNLDFRLRGSIPLKFGITTSAIYRNTQGANENATWAIPANAATLPAYGFRWKTVNTPGGRTTLTAAKTINLFVNNSLFGDRFQQLDFSVNKSFNLGWGRLRAALDLYNALNGNSIQNLQSAYGFDGTKAPGDISFNKWLKPTQFIDPRLVRVTASIDF